MLFVLRKVDEATRTFYAYIDETPDHAREILDYATAKPAFEKWSSDQFEASGGKSYGNLREMHAKSAIGILDRPLEFDDEARRIGFYGKVVDDAAWEKFIAGVYTGVSPGGGYAKRWADPSMRGYQRYTPVIAELSAVDKPCIPSGTFQFVKADGVVEDREFVVEDYNPTRDEVRALATDLAKSAGKPDRVSDFVVMARSQLISAHAEELAKAALDPAEPDELEKALAEAEELLGKKAPKPYGDVDYADAADGKYPIDTAAHIRAAWSYVNMPKNADKLGDKLEAVKGKIVAAWKAKIDKDGPPSMEKAEFLTGLFKSGAALQLLIAISTVGLEKGFYTVGETSRVLARMAELAESVIWEECYEGDDDSNLPQAACDLVAATKSFLIDMLNEETAEFFAQAEHIGGDGIALLAPCFGADGMMMELAANAGDLQKLHQADGPLLEKIGKRMSAKDSKHVQSMHDHSMALGAKCDSGNCDAEKLAKLAGPQAEELTKARRSLATATGAITSLNKAVVDLTASQEADRAQIAELAAKLEKLGSGPAPAKGVLLSINKEDDNGGLFEKVDGVNPDGPMPDDPGERHTWAMMRKRAREGGGVPAISAAQSRY